MAAIHYTNQIDKYLYSIFVINKRQKKRRNKIYQSSVFVYLYFAAHRERK